MQSERVKALFLFTFIFLSLDLLSNKHFIWALDIKERNSNLIVDKILGNYLQIYNAIERFYDRADVAGEV